MLKSMTGYGRSEKIFGNKKIIVEIRSLNSKQLDMSVRLPSIYKEKDVDIRNEISKVGQRGKMDVYVSIEQSERDKAVTINSSVVKNYIEQISVIASEFKIPITDQLLSTALRLPETLISENVEVSDEEWKVLFDGFAEALEAFNKFRIQEGKVLEKDIENRINLILSNLTEIAKFEDARMTKYKERIKKNLNDILSSDSIDANRFEQELIYYLEKIDITEEKVRLANHCNYFSKTVQEENSGRKLGFITQEIGREINTIGSKANDSDMQRYVVMMKDELEKVKEQLLNII